MYITMKGNRTLPSCCDRIDGKSRSCIHITADEDIRLRGLIGQFICQCTAVRPSLQIQVIQHITPFDRLSYGKDHMLTRYGHSLLFIVFR